MMIRTAFLFLSAIVMLTGPLTAHAQDSPDDRARRIELAKEMHKIRPARAQVQEAIDQVSQNLPPIDRDRFMRMVSKAFDYDKLEQLSLDTMADLFTVAELQKMVDYFGSPEAKSVAEKLPKYQEKIQPEIIRMLDAALMTEKTGGPADKIVPPDDKAAVPDAENSSAAQIP